MAKFWDKIKKTIGRGTAASTEESETIPIRESRLSPTGKESVDKKTKGETSDNGDQDLEIPGAEEEDIVETQLGIGEKISEVTRLFVAKTQKWVSWVGKKAPRIAERIAEKTQRMASVVSEKTGEAVAFSKLKIRIHHLKNHVEQTRSELGGRAYELMKEDQTDIYEDDTIKALIEKIQSFTEEIEATQKEIEELHADEKTDS